MIKIKSISKRVLAVILATLMLLTSGIVGTLAANVEMVATGATLSSDGTAILFMDLSNPNWWLSNSGQNNFCYFFNSSSNAWSAHAVNYSGNDYYVVVPKGDWTTVILSRNNTTTSPSWSNKWNQTGNITLSNTSNCLYGFSENSTSASWSTIKPASNVSLSASKTDVTTGTNVTLTPSLTSNTTFNTIKSTTYSISPSSGASISGNTFTATTAGTYTVTANITYNARGYSNLTTTKTATKTITVTQPGYTYTVSAGEGGTITSATSGTATSATITAKADTGYTFDKWTVTGGTVANENSASTTFTITANNATAVASFTKNNYTLTVNQSGDAIGTVTLNGSNINLESYTKNYDYNTKITYNIDAPDNCVINTLSVGDSNISAASGKGTYTGSITITKDTAITVSYKLTSHTVTVTEVGGEGTITGGGSVTHGSTTTITVTPPTGHTATISGAGITETSGITDTQSFETGEITADTTVTVTYTPIVYTVTFEDYEGNEVTTQQVPYGSYATAPDTSAIRTPEGKEFKSWDKDVASTKITGDTTFTAQYADKVYTVTVNASPANGGTVTGGESGTVTHNGNLTFVATPTPDSFYRLSGWTIEGSYASKVESGSTLTLNGVTSNIKVTAVFNMADTGTVNATVDSNMGTVSPATTTVTLNTPVKVTASAKTGYKFSSWNVTSAGTAGTDYTVSENGAEITITPITDGVVVNVEAVFVGVTGTVNFVAGNGGTVNDETSITETVTYPNAATATATATAEGVQFAGWTVTAVKSDGTNASKGTDYNYNSLSNETIEVTVITDGVTVTATANFSSGYSIDAYYLSANNFTDIDILEYKDASTHNTVYTGAAQGTEKFGNDTWNYAGTVDFKAGYTHSVTAQMYKGSGSGDGSVNIYVDFTDGLTNWNNGNKGKEGEFYLAVTASTNSGKELDTKNTDHVARNTGITYVPGNDIWIDNALGKKVTGSTYMWTIPAEYVDELTSYGFTIYSKNLTGYDSVYEANAAHVIYSSSKDLYKLSSTAGTYVSTDDRKAYLFDITASDTMPSTSDPYEIVNDLYPNGVWCDKDAVWIYDSGNSVSVTFRKELDTELANKKYKTAYDAGMANSSEYSSGWTDNDNDKTNDYKSAYENAVEVLGNGASTQKQIDDALEALKVTYGNLVQNQSISVKLSHGMVNGTDEYYGTSAFVSGVTNKGSASGNINTIGITVLTATAQRNQPIVVQTTVKDSSYYVKGYIINGTSFKDASETTENVFTATITLTESAVIVPVYFKDGVNEDNPNVVKLYAMNDDVDDWTDFMAAYVWYANGGYEQFGDWTGQLLIPDFSSGKKMYYTFVEKTDGSGNKVAGITFNNYGNNYQINDGPNGENNRRQTYDYHEFLALQDYKNITFVLKKSDSSRTFLSGTNPGASAVQGHKTYELMTNIDGEPIDIYGKVLETVPTTQQADALYIIRDGHIVSNQGAGLGFIGTRTKNEDGTTTLTVSQNSYTGDYYVDCYVYDGKTGTRLAYVKSYELEDLEVLAHEDGRDVDLSAYKGKPVYVDYESRQGQYGGGDDGHYEINVYRYDGEWYAYNDEANFTVEVITALQGADGKYTFADADENGLRNQADWGNVNVTANDETNGLVTVSQGTDYTITAGNSDGYNFVGWYYAEKDENGNITIGDEYTDVRTGSGKAIGSALFVAVYKEHVAGSIYVRNFAYNPMENVDVNKGQSLSMYAPKAYGEGNLDLSVRYVQVTILDENGDIVEERAETLGQPNAYQDYIEQVETGQTLRITMFTQPTISTDYVYAWYRQTYDDAEQMIVNYEEVAPKGAPFGPDDAGDLQQFTFEYKIGTEIPNEIVIYSDVVHQSRDVTITYKYHNRYNDLVSYTTKYKLEGDEFTNMRPSYDTVKDLAPYVDDIYKKVTWEFEEKDITQNATDFVVYAKEEPTFTVNLFAGLKTKTYKDVPFNTAMDVYAVDIDDTCNKRGGVWFQDANENAQYDEGVDKLLNYGNYLGLVVTDDMNIVYTDEEELVYQIILGDPVYGREQITDASGNNVVDKIYVDYIISYMIPHFSGDTIDTEGKENDTSDDVTLKDDVNGNTPVQIKTLEAAGLKVDYGVVLEMVNVNGLTSEQFENYYDVKEMSDATYNALNPIIRAKVEGTDAKGQGVYEDGTLATYFYVYESTNASNKNRVLKTFAFDNTPANQKKYYNVYGYLKITDKANNVSTYYSNPKTLNIMDESIDNTAN